MYWSGIQKIQTLRLLSNAFILLLLLAFAVVHCYFYFSKSLDVESIWWSKEQRAAQKWQRNDYLSAARLLSLSPSLSASAFYAAEDFPRASMLFARQHGFEGYFSLANSLAHQERYEDAIIAYRMALALKPDSQRANHNRELAEVLKEKPRQLRDKDQDSKSDFSADEISFDLDKQNGDKAVDDALASGDLGEGALRQLWLRQLNRKPVDFLQRKFAYQLQQKNLEESANESIENPSGERP